ncbi:anti-sigma factor [Streptomyces endophyticus]|uniref:Regulator of SigK n=1 Tax=Streptomyces endophyticus TaxID=714166 RepID=A0ABU6FAN7_9ACTN|nr:anti-sigma factor [Streptomyces endophyticus]MEB8339916.1 anti-sigma factor [Streptomyces endophyticus]
MNLRIRLTHRPRSLVAPYALDALEPREGARFERHLKRCDACADEVRALTESSVRLACSASVAPPTELRERVLTAVRLTEQVTVEPRPRTAPRARGLLIPLGVATGAGALTVAALFAVQLERTSDRLDAQRAAAREVARVLAAPDASAVRADGLNVVASPERGSAVITVTGLRAPPRGKAHQLWLMEPSAPPRSLGVLPDGGSDTPVVATGLTPDASSLAVTTEPNGGSARPTGAPLVQLALESVGFGG